MTKRQYITVELSEVRQRVSDGADSRAIAAEVGASSAAIYRLCDKAGIPIRGRRVHAHENIDSLIADMRPTDATEYLVEAFKQVTGQQDETLELADLLGLSPTEAMIFGLLYRSVGRHVPTERVVALLDVSQPGNEDRNTLNVLQAYIHRMRRKLEGKYTMTGRKGQGYMMVSQ